MAKESSDNLDALGDEMGKTAGAEFIDNAKPPEDEDKSEDDKAKDDESADDEPKDDEKSDEDDKSKGDESEDEPSESDELDELASPLTHEDVQDSEAFQGLLGETRELREDNKALRDKLAASEAKPPEDEEEEEDDDDETVFTRKEVKTIVANAIAKEVPKAIKPYTDKSNARDHRQSLVTDIAAMQADASIPKGLKLNSICNASRKHMAKHASDLLESIEGKPGMARQLYAYGSLNVPSIQNAITKARSTHEDQETERTVKGQSDTDDEPQDFFDAAFDKTAKDAE